MDQLEPDQQNDQEEELDRGSLDRAGLIEPATATRMSPYAIGAFVLGVAGLWELPQRGSFLGFSWSGGDWVFGLIFLSFPAVSAGLALWLTGWAEAEIALSEGRLGGVGLCRAAQAMAIVTLVGVVVIVVAAFVP
jgi:hypothetical protein